MNKIEPLVYWTFTVQTTLKLGCEEQKKTTNRKYYANPAQQIGNVTSCSTHKFIHKLNVHKYFNLDEPKYKICCFSCTVKNDTFSVSVTQ